MKKLIFLILLLLPTLALGGTSLLSDQASITSTVDNARISAVDGTAAIPSYTFSTDLNTGMFLSAADTLSFSTNGVERMVLNNTSTIISTGLSIGTGLAPVTTLDVISSGALTTTIQTGASIYATTSGTAANGFGVALEFGAEASDGNTFTQTVINSLWTDATTGTRTSALTLMTRSNAGALTERMRISGVGNVGIGIAPVERLHVSANSSSLITSRFENLGVGGQRLYITATTGDPFIYFEADATTDWSIGIDNSDSDTFKISNATTLGPSDIVNVTTLGQVGIGTSTPAENQKLHVSGNHLQIGETDVGARKGITLFDTTDGSAHCVTINTDVLNVAAGACS